MQTTITSQPKDVVYTQTTTAVAQRLARGAHNSEVTRSKRVGGIIQFASFKEAGRHSSRDVKHEHKRKPFTGVAQRQRVGLITPRSLDRDESPVCSNSRALKKYAVIARAT
jgi:hypothetical protein